MKLVRFALRLIITLVVLAVVFVGVVYANSLAISAADHGQQKALADTQERLINSGGLAEWAETPIDDAAPLTAVQFIASHNSYATQPNGLQNFVLGLVRPGEPEKLAYSHPGLWQQFDEGVRSIELDLRVHRSGKLRLTHVPLLANGSVAPDFGLALDEIKRWSDAHPGHLPIIVLIEFKSDYRFLDPTLAAWSTENLALVDEALKEQLGETLLLPADLSAWPTVEETRDTVIVVMHPNSEVEAHYRALPAADRTMLIGQADAASATAAGAQFVVHNDPDAAAIRRLVEAGVLVRTRADADLVTDPGARDGALGSGAQIISTDFWAPHAQEGTGYVVEFGDGTLARLAPK